VILPKVRNRKGFGEVTNKITFDKVMGGMGLASTVRLTFPVDSQINGSTSRRSWVRILAHEYYHGNGVPIFYDNFEKIKTESSVKQNKCFTNNLRSFNFSTHLFVGIE